MRQVIVPFFFRNLNKFSVELYLFSCILARQLHHLPHYSCRMLERKTKWIHNLPELDEFAQLSQKDFRVLGKTEKDR